VDFLNYLGGGRPSLQNILTEIGFENIQGYISIDEAKPKLIEKFKDPQTAQLAFSKACQNKFDIEVFARMETVNNAHFEAINKLEDLLGKNTELEKQFDDYLAKIVEYKHQKSVESFK
jgi:hypothetical protein